uniref:Uncharacterized protein n=1 Tax=Acrobeloides nanus TaxID=290746 RepID=A0A914C6U6_9BILA
MICSMAIILLVGLLGADATISYHNCTDLKQLCIDGEEICVPTLERDNGTRVVDLGYVRNYIYDRTSYSYACKECDAQGPALECPKLDEKRQAGYECCPDQFCSLKREKNLKHQALISYITRDISYDFWHYACRKCPAGQEIHECQEKRVKCCSSEFCSYDYINEINICQPKCEEGFHQCPDNKLGCCNSEKCAFDYGANHYVCQKKNKKPS